MCVQQALTAMTKYSQLPDEIVGEVKIHALMKKGTTEMEKQYHAEMKSTWEERRRKKHASKKFKPLNVSDMQKEASSRVTKHDKG